MEADMDTLIIYGFGKIGTTFVTNNMDYINKYNKVYFYDNNCNLPNEIFGIERIGDLSNAYNIDVVLAGLQWPEMYKECSLKGIEVVGIVSSKDYKVYSVKEYCKLTHSLYKNMRQIDYEHNKAQTIIKNKKNFLVSGDLFESIREVCISLSNICNYSCIHAACPASLEKKPIVMPENLVMKIVSELADSGFDGEICFHAYNEPLIDPRIFMIMNKCRKLMKNVGIRIYTNGFYLDRVIYNELILAGMTSICITGYGEKEYSRLIDLDDERIPFAILYGNLDSRLDWYEKNKEMSIEKPCESLLNQVVIHPNGDIGICCLDYRHGYDIGNVNISSLRNILNSERVTNFQKALLKGDRSFFKLCQNCDWAR